MASRPILPDAALEIVQGMNEEAIRSLRGQRGVLRIGGFDIQVIVAEASVPNPDPFGWAVAVPPLLGGRLVLHARIHTMETGEPFPLPANGDEAPVPDHVATANGGIPGQP